MNENERRGHESALLTAIKRELPSLEKLLVEINGEWAYEDLVYRFYHQSFKVYYAQKYTTRIVESLHALLPVVPLDDQFSKIVADGTGVTFTMEHNKRWLEVTRPILEALFHAKYFLEMVCKYGRELDEPQNLLPSGWAAVLCLYGLR